MVEPEGRRAEVSEVHEAAAGRRANKRASAFRTIGEVAEDLDLPAHVLRFWESKFPQLKPLKRGGGRRYYRPEDIALLRRIRECLYKDGYTIRGVQKLLREGGLGDESAVAAESEEVTLFPLDPIPTSPPKSPRRAVPAVIEPVAPTVDRTALEEARQELLEVRALLEQLRSRP